LITTSKARIEDMGNAIAEFRLKENKSFKYTNHLEQKIKGLEEEIRNLQKRFSSFKELKDKKEQEFTA
jgi:septal ring factor EnvC (AmiA/AmiB activator)